MPGAGRKLRNMRKQTSIGEGGAKNQMDQLFQQEQKGEGVAVAAEDVDDEGLSDIDIQHFINRTQCIQNKRAKVVAADELESKKRLGHGQIRITNTMDRASGGEHWILFHIQKINKKYIVNYFDPVGECLLDYHPNIKKFFQNYNMVICNKGIPVQHDGKSSVFSSTCGMHCAFVAWLLCNQPKKYKSLNDVMRVYDISNSYHGVNYNECMVLYNMCKIYGKKMCKRLKKLPGCK